MKGQNTIDVLISNPSPKKVRWYFDLSGLETDISTVFKVAPERGILDFDEEMMIKFSFSPYMVGEYECKMPIYLEENPTKVYQFMHLKGVGAKPRLLFDRR